jgi:hypothetical protein
MRTLAATKGGKCISRSYVDTSNPLKWKCVRGHRWESSFNVVNMGVWCLNCINIDNKENRKKQAFIVLQEIAESRNGELLSKEYVNSKSPMKWKCAEGHVWLADASDIKNAHKWCRICSNKRNGVKRRIDISVYKAIARKHGGKLLSEEYLNNSTPLKWECRRGHTWMAAPKSIKNKGGWCPECFEKERGKTRRTGIEFYKDLAFKREGKLLSVKYTNTFTPLKWQCKKGHIWEAQPGNIKEGSWCPDCVVENRRKRFRDELVRLARNKNGKVLSEYINNKTPIQWQCKNGHTWTATPQNVKDNNNWCPYCKKIRRSFLSLFSCFSAFLFLFRAFWHSQIIAVSFIHIDNLKG